MTKERREGLRYPVRVDVVLDDDARFNGGATIDLSDGGALVELSVPTTPGEHVRVIPLVDTRVAVFELSGRVLRCSPTPNGKYLVAIALELAPREQGAYAALFEQLSWTISAPQAV